MLLLPVCGPGGTFRLGTASCRRGARSGRLRGFEPRSCVVPVRSPGRVGGAGAAPQDAPGRSAGFGGEGHRCPGGAWGAAWRTGRRGRGHQQPTGSPALPGGPAPGTAPHRRTGVPPPVRAPCGRLPATGRSSGGGPQIVRRPGRRADACRGPAPGARAAGRAARRRPGPGPGRREGGPQVEPGHVRGPDGPGTGRAGPKGGQRPRRRRTRMLASPRDSRSARTTATASRTMRPRSTASPCSPRSTSRACSRSMSSSAET